MKPTFPLVAHRDPEIVGGVPVFVGTRVLVRIFFEYLVYGLLPVCKQEVLLT